MVNCSKKNREGALGTKVRGCSFFEGDASHTAQARPLGSRIEDGSEAPQQKAFSTHIKNKTENRSKIFDLNQTALLPHFRNLRETGRRRRFFRPILPKKLACTDSEWIRTIQNRKDGEDRN